MSTRKRTSLVSEYFAALVAIKENGKDVVKVQCKLCGMQLVHRGGTTSLALHLSAKHMCTCALLGANSLQRSKRHCQQLFATVLLNAPPQLLG